jgi:hypothetical protein
MKNYGRVAHSALAYAMNDEFSRVLHQQMEFFSSNPSADTLNRLRGEVSEASTCFIRLIFFLKKKTSFLSNTTHVSNSCRFTLSWSTTLRKSWIEAIAYRFLWTRHPPCKIALFISASSPRGSAEPSG